GGAGGKGLGGGGSGAGASPPPRKEGRGAGGPGKFRPPLSGLRPDRRKRRSEPDPSGAARLTPRRNLRERSWRAGSWPPSRSHPPASFAGAVSAFGRLSGPNNAQRRPPWWI